MIFQASFYKSKKLLLIEDCEPVRASIKGMLQQIGFDDITTAADALQAVALTKKHSFDFVLADFDLGAGQDALQLFANVRQEALLKSGCCFLLMSAEPRRLPVLGLLQGAPDAFILKPFSYVELEKRLAKVWNHRLKLRKVYQALQDDDHHTAQLELDQVINARNAVSLPALRLMAEVLLSEGNFSAAQKLYEKVLQQRDFSWSRLGYAVSLLQQQQFADAQQLLQDMTDADDIRPEALQWLACLYLQQGQYGEARQQLAELLKYQPTHIEAHLGTATALELSGNIDDAIKYWQKLIQQYRFSGFDRSEFYCSLCRLLLQQAQRAALPDVAGLIKKAIDALSSLPNKLQSEKTDVAIAVLRARINVMQGNFADAIQQLEVLQQGTIPADAAVLFDCASLTFSLGELKLSEQYVSALKAYPRACTDLFSCSQNVLAAHLLQREQKLRAGCRQWQQKGIELLQKGDASGALASLRQTFMYMPCNAVLILNLLQTLTTLPPDKKLTALAKMILNALEFSSKTAENQQQLANLLPTLPELYLS